MALFEGISPETAATLAKAFVDELALKYPPEMFEKLIDKLAFDLRGVVVGREITTTIK